MSNLMYFGAWRKWQVAIMIAGIAVVACASFFWVRSYKMFESIEWSGIGWLMNLARAKVASC